MKVCIIAFTKGGTALAAQLAEALGPDTAAYGPERYCAPPVRPLTQPLGVWTGERFLAGTGLVFVGAAGIAVRAIAPYIRGKDSDPAVVCMDEGGRYAIPLLSGHIGGANRLARQIARHRGATPVITTATDVRGCFSPDAWAAENGYAVETVKEIKHIAAALLDGEPVGFASSFPVVGALPGGVEEIEHARCGMEISLRSRQPFPHTLHLVPKCLIVGMGCRRGVSAERLRSRLEHTLAEHHLPLSAVGAVATIDLKADEVGLLELCTQLRVPLHTYSAAQLMAVPGAFTPSERVVRVTGADNVCERAAVAAGGELIVNKTAGDGVTVAVSRQPWTVEFEG